MSSIMMLCISIPCLAIIIAVWQAYRRTTDLYRFSRAKDEQLVRYMEWLFCRKGYEITEVKYVSGREAEAVILKNSVMTMVQIRQRKGKVTRTMVEFLYTTALKADCDWAMIICLAGFTREAKKAARELGITLYDRCWLRSALKGCRLKFTA